MSSCQGQSLGEGAARDHGMGGVDQARCIIEVTRDTAALDHHGGGIRIADGFGALNSSTRHRKGGCLSYVHNAVIREGQVGGQGNAVVESQRGATLQ